MRAIPGRVAPGNRGWLVLALAYLKDQLDRPAGRGGLFEESGSWSELKGASAADLSRIATRWISRHRGDPSLELVSQLVDETVWRNVFEAPGALRELFSVADELVLSPVDSVDRLKEADELFAAAMTSIGRAESWIYTPQAVAQLMARLLGATEGDVYDPASGTGTLLLAAYEQAAMKSPEPNLRLFGQDISRRAVAAFKLNVGLHGLNGGVEVVSGDTLAEPKYLDDGSLRRFEHILAAPPLGVKLRSRTKGPLEADSFDRFQLSLASGDGDLAFLEHIVASLADDGRAVVLAPPGVLFRGNHHAAMRRWLLEGDLLDAVISLPRNLLAHTGIPAAVLVLSKGRAGLHQGAVRFLVGDQLISAHGGLDEAISTALVDFMRDASPAMDVGVTVSNERLLEGDAVLSPARHVSFLRRKMLLGGRVRWRKLSELVSEGNAGIADGVRMRGDPGPGEVPIIRGRDVSNPVLELDGLERVNPPDEGALTVQAGDVVLQGVGDRLAARLVGEDLAGALVGRHVYRIRLSEQYRSLALFIVEFLNSEQGQLLLSGRVVGIMPMLRARDVREIEVPIPEDAVLALVDTLHSAERELLARVRTTQGLRAQLFGVEDPDKAREELRALTSQADVLAASLVQSDDFDFQVRNFYPYPLAYAYRTLSASQSGAERYKEQLRVAENILGFLASVGLAIVGKLGRQVAIGDSTSMKESLRAAWSGGISPGTWLAIGRESARALRGVETYDVVQNFSSIWFKGKGARPSDFSQALERLVKLKNDDKHDRGPKTAPEYREGCEELDQLLRKVLEELAFFVRSPIRHVLRADYDELEGEYTYKTLVYAGDHPGLRQETLRGKHPVSAFALYLELGEDDWLLLSPFVTVHTCQKCRTRETYSIDRWSSSDGKVSLRSFERGHALALGLKEEPEYDTGPSVAKDLEKWINLHG